MITYLPEIYEDVTIYSFLSRAYEKGGYVSQTQAKKEFFNNPSESLDFYFCNRLTNELIGCITKNYIWNDFLVSHTLCNYYGRFLKKDKRIQAMNGLINLQGKYNNLFVLARPRNRNGCLKYCPICVKENRKKYGETYWNRVHQIPELNVCPKHNCRLLNSTIKNNDRDTRTFNTAENCITYLEIIKATDIERNISKYVDKMVHVPMDLNKEIYLGDFFRSKMVGTGYLSKSGRYVKINNIYNDISNFYHDLENGIWSIQQITKILNNTSTTVYNTIQISMFLNIPPNELIECTVPDKKPDEIIEEKIVEMLYNRKTAEEIAKEMNVSVDYVGNVRKFHNCTIYKNPKCLERKMFKRQDKILKTRKIWIETMKKYPDYSFKQICKESKYGAQLKWLDNSDPEWTKKHFPQRKRGNRKDKILRLDEEYYPKMNHIIEDYNKNYTGIPRQLSINSISKIIGISSCDLRDMKKCREIIENHKESPEKIYTKKIIWAVSKLEEENKNLTWTNVIKTVYIKKDVFYKYEDYFRKELGDDIINKIYPPK